MPRIHNERLSRTVADDIQQQIIKKKLSVGDQLPTEPKLMEEYGVSRTVIREAAACLVSRGVVDVRPRRGMTVRAPDGKGLAESLTAQLQMSDVSLPQLFEVRSVLETAIVKLAAQERTADDIAKLRENLRHMEFEDLSREDVLTVDIKFHDLLAAATHNPFFVLVSRPITELLYTLYIDRSGYMSFRSLTCLEHTEIVDTIDDGDVDGAIAAMKKHLDRVRTTSEKMMLETTDEQH